MSVLPCPDRLKGPARELWLRLAPRLELDPLAAAVFEGLCDWYGRHAKALDSLAKLPQGAAKGTSRQLRDLVNLCERNVKRTAKHFGLAPADVSPLRILGE